MSNSYDHLTSSWSHILDFLVDREAQLSQVVFKAQLEHLDP